MKYRPHRGSLDTAMLECVELPGTMEALRDHVGRSNEGWLDPSTVKVELYSGPDNRIGWELTFIVMATWADGRVAPVGFTDALPDVFSA